MTYKEYKKWLFENWNYICKKFEENFKNNPIQNNFINIKDLNLGTPNDFTIAKYTDKIYTIPIEPKPIKIVIEGRDSNEDI